MDKIILQKDIVVFGFRLEKSASIIVGFDLKTLFVEYKFGGQYILFPLKCSSYDKTIDEFIEEIKKLNTND